MATIIVEAVRPGRCYTVRHLCLPYPLPKGLAEGTRVLVLQSDHMSSLVIDEAGNEWTVSDLCIETRRRVIP